MRAPLSRNENVSKAAKTDCNLGKEIENICKVYHALTLRAVGFIKEIKQLAEKASWSNNSTV